MSVEYSLLTSLSHSKIYYFYPTHSFSRSLELFRLFRNSPPFTKPKYRPTRLKLYLLMWHLVYIVTFPVVPINPSLLIITHCSTIITSFVYNETDYSVHFMRLCPSSPLFISKFSPYSPVSDPKPVHVGPVVDRVALEYVALRVLPLFPTLARDGHWR
jgi:hypothetical protein